MRRLARIVIALTVLCGPMAATVPPASAAFEWIRSGCRPDVWWYHQPGSYVQYYREGDAWPGSVWAVHENWPATRPPSHIDVYARNGYECGRFGAPLGDMWSQNNGWWRQSFERGALWYSSLGWWWWCPWGQNCVGA